MKKVTKTTIELDDKKVITTEVKLPDGKVISRTVETPLKFNSKSAGNSAKNDFIERISELAQKNLIPPHATNRLVYTIKEYKADYNEKKWYLNNMNSTNASYYVNSLKCRKNFLEVYHDLFKNIKDNAFKLKDETISKIKEMYIKECWHFITEFPDEKDCIPNKVFNFLMQNEQNKKIWELRLQQTKKCSELGKELV